MRQTLSRMILGVVLLILATGSLRYLMDAWPLAFFHSLQTHIGILLALAVCLSLVLSRSWLGAVILVLCLAYAAHPVFMLRAAATQLQSGDEKAPLALKLLSFNILGDNFINAFRLTDVILESGADVAVVLEALPLQSHLQQLEAVYPYRIGCGNNTPTCDLMVLSKRPLDNIRVDQLSDLRRDRAMFADLTINGQVVHFAAVHLSKPYFDSYHSDELANLLGMLRKVEGPLIVAGDFNSAVIAPDMQRFLRRFKLYTGPAEPATWPIALGRYGITIDHILARQPLVIRSVTRLPESYGSNHYGLMADIILR